MQRQKILRAELKSHLQRFTFFQAEILVFSVHTTHLWFRQQYMMGLYIVELMARRKTARYTC